MPAGGSRCAGVRIKASPRGNGFKGRLRNVSEKGCQDKAEGAWQCGRWSCRGSQRHPDSIRNDTGLRPQPPLSPLLSLSQDLSHPVSSVSYIRLLEPLGALSLLFKLKYLSVCCRKYG